MQSFACVQINCRNKKCARLLLRQDAAQMGPLWRGERVEEKPEGALRAHGCALSDPRSPLANSEGRMPGERATGVCFFW